MVGHARASTVKLAMGQRKALLVATAFANSTGLPTTILSMMTTTTSDDPTRFLSIYLILYPILQWGIGGTLLGLNEPAEGSNSFTPDQRQQQHQSNTTTTATTNDLVIQNDEQHNNDDGDDSHNEACLTDEEDTGLLENENDPKVRFTRHLETRQAAKAGPAPYSTHFGPLPGAA